MSPEQVAERIRDITLVNGFIYPVSEVVILEEVFDESSQTKSRGVYIHPSDEAFDVWVAADGRAFERMTTYIVEVLPELQIDHTLRIKRPDNATTETTDSSGRKGGGDDRNSGNAD